MMVIFHILGGEVKLDRKEERVLFFWEVVDVKVDTLYSEFKLTVCTLQFAK